MVLRKIVQKSIVCLVICSIPIVLLLTTNAGLKVILTAATMFAPIQFSYGSVSGKLLGQPIKINDLYIEQNGHPLKVGNVTLDWQQRLFSAQNIQGIEPYLPMAEDITYNQMHIDSIHGYVTLHGNKHVFKLQMRGHAKQTPILATSLITHIGDLWDIQYAYLTYGTNLAKIEQQANQKYIWQLMLNDPASIFQESHGTLQANGSIANLHAIPSIEAKVIAKKFGISDYQINNLNADINMQLQSATPIHAKINASQLVIGTQQIQNLNLNLTGTLEQHTLISHATYNKDPISFTMRGNFVDQVWDITQIILSYKKEQLQGHGKYYANTNSGNLKLAGSIMHLPTQADLQVDRANSALQFKIHANAQNAMQGLINVNAQKLSGSINTKIDDLAFLMQWMPDVTRLKGKLLSEIKISGTTDKPEIVSSTKITEITATVPSLGIKIKPIEIYINSDKQGKFNVHGTGHMRRGPGEFKFYGFIEPLKDDCPNLLTVEATKLEFVNNQMAQLLASSKLNVHFAKQRQQLDLTGDIEIHSGKVVIPDKRTQTVKSKDVVFVNESNAIHKRLLSVNPNINLRINDDVHFKGFDLAADVSGKLNISHRHGALYADGRVTIKQGSYELPGQKLHINHGRLLYPPGTLLVNPVLDIKMVGKDKGRTVQDNTPDIELSVQGTAQKPMISETGLSNNQDRALSQVMLTSSSVISNNILQDKLKIAEIGLASREEEHVAFFDDPSVGKNALKNKDFVIGRPLGRKFYVQYLHSVSEANQRVRLKYALNNIWSIGIESGTSEDGGLGGGVDLSFAIERD